MTAKEMTVKQIEDAKAELFKLCNDFNGDDDVSCRISLLSSITGGCFAPNDEGDEGFDANYVINTYYSINQIMIFLAALHENINKIETFENRLKKPEFACY